ncbi:MAG: serine protease, partial [Lachnospiraceae bacterium]|nr:serine protease [Lachnospiraceae bacterium]
MKWWKKYGALAMSAVVLSGACVEAGILYTSNSANAEETEETQRVTLNVVNDEETIEDVGESETGTPDESETAAGSADEAEASGESERVTLNVGGGDAQTSAEDAAEEETSAETEELQESETEEIAESAEEIEIGSGTQIGSVETGTGSIVTTDVSEIVENCLPSIVSISYDIAEETDSDTESSSGTDGYYYSDGYYYYIDETTEEDVEEETTASGIIIAQTDEELLIATNCHVVSDATNLTVSFSVDAEDEKDLTVSAKVKGTSSGYDLAVIAVQISDIDSSVLEQLRVATLGSSEDLKVGEAAIAISNASEYGQ